MADLGLRPWKACFFVAVFLLVPTVWAGPIHIGDIGTQPAEQIRNFWPFASYLAKQLQPEGIDQGKMIIARSIPEMANLLLGGKVDLYIDSPFPVLAVSRLSGSKFLLRRWKAGQGEYRAVIFTRKDSDVSRLEDLKGRLIGFEEPFSTSTYFIPKLVMVQKGFKLVRKTSDSDPVSPNEVGYLFLGDDPNIMFGVLKGRVTAGVLNNKNYLKEARTNLDSLKIIHETPPLPRQIVSYRADLNPKLVARIKEILIKMDQSEEGRKALKDFEDTTKFDEIPDHSMALLSNAQKLIDAELGSR